jgi:hypothetical protein
MRGTSTSTFHIHIHIHRPSSSRSLQAAAEARQAQARWLARDEIGIRYPVTPTLFVHSLNLFATVREQLLRTVRETECGPINNRHMHPLQLSICITDFPRKKKCFQRACLSVLRSQQNPSHRKLRERFPVAVTPTSQPLSIPDPVAAKFN